MSRRTLRQICGVGLFCLSVLLSPPASQAQDAESMKKLAEKAQALLKKKGFVPQQLPKGAIDPSKYDVFPLVSTWNRARPELEKLLETELRLDEQKKLDLRLVFTPDKKEKHYRAAFPDQPEAVKKVLRAVLPLHDGSFIDVKLRQTHAVDFKRTKDFRAAYLKEGKVNFAEVGKTLGNMERPKPFKGVEVDFVKVDFPSPKDSYLYAQSAYAKLEGSAVEGVNYFGRLEYGIERPTFDQDGTYWKLFVHFRIVSLKTENGDDPETAEKHGKSLGISDKLDGLNDSLVFVNRDGIASPSSELSPLRKLSEKMLEQLKAKLLTEKGREK